MIYSPEDTVREIGLCLAAVKGKRRRWHAIPALWAMGRHFARLDRQLPACARRQARHLGPDHLKILAEAAGHLPLRRLDAAAYRAAAGRPGA